MKLIKEKYLVCTTEGIIVIYEYSAKDAERKARMMGYRLTGSPTTICGRGY